MKSDTKEILKAFVRSLYQLANLLKHLLEKETEDVDAKIEK